MLKCDRQSCCLSKVYFPLNSFALCLAVLNANTCPVWMAPERVAVYVENNRQPGSSLGFWTELVSAVCSECYVTALFRSPLLIFWQCRIWRAQISGLNLMSVCHTLFGLKQCVFVCVWMCSSCHSICLNHINTHTQAYASPVGIYYSWHNSMFSSTHGITSQAYKLTRGDSTYTVLWVIDFKIPVSCWSPLCNPAHVCSLSDMFL